MWKRWSTDKDFRAVYEVDGQQRERTITLSADMCNQPGMAEYNCRVMLRQSTSFKTARSYDSFRLVSVQPTLTRDEAHAEAMATHDDTLEA